MSAEPFPARLARLRKAAGLTQSQLAEKIGSWQGDISSYENGNTKPSLETVLYLSEALGVSLDELVRGAPENTSGKSRNSP